MVFYGLKDLVLTYVSEEDSEKFALWSFGEKYRELEGTEEFMVAWNLAHCEELELTGTENVSESIWKMVNIWRESLKPAKETWGKSIDRWSDR